MGNYVSLLPPEYTQRLKKSDKLRKIVIVMIIVAAITFAILMVSVANMAAGKIRMAAVMLETEQVQWQMDQLSDVEAKRRVLMELRDRIVGIQSKDPLLIGAVAEISRLVPSGVRVDTMYLMVDKDGAKICTLDCVGSSYNDIARFMEVLSGSVQISDVVCDSSGEEGENIKFTLKITLTRENSGQEAGE